MNGITGMRTVQIVNFRVYLTQRRELCTYNLVNTMNGSMGTVQIVTVQKEGARGGARW